MAIAVVTLLIGGLVVAVSPDRSDTTMTENGFPLWADRSFDGEAEVVHFPNGMALPVGAFTISAPFGDNTGVQNKRGRATDPLKLFEVGQKQLVAMSSG